MEKEQANWVDVYGELVLYHCEYLFSPIWSRSIHNCYYWTIEQINRSNPKQVVIQDGLVDLKRLQKRSSPLIAARIGVLIAIKRAGVEGISKRVLAQQTGVDPNSVQTWRSLYVEGGLQLVCSHKKRGFKPSVITAQEHQEIKQKLEDPKNGLRGYVELQRWLIERFAHEVKYNTLLKYCVRKFGSKVKVARKSHVKKDPEATGAFKKTSDRSAKRSASKRRATTPK